MATKLETAKALVNMAAAFPNFTLTEETIEKYSQHLSQIAPELLFKACLVCERECKFFPTISEIYDAAKEVLAREHGIDKAWARHFIESGEYQNLLGGDGAKLLE